MSLNPGFLPFVPFEKGSADFSALKRAQLDQILLSLPRDQGMSALIFENDVWTSEATKYLESLLPDTVRAAYLEAPWSGESDFLQALCRALDIAPLANDAADAVPHHIAHLVSSLNEIGHHTAPNVLIVKNAHLATASDIDHLMALSLEALERAVRWSQPADLDLSTERAGMLHTLLIGRHELRQRMPQSGAGLPYGGKLAIHHFPDLSEFDTIDHIRATMDSAGLLGPLPFDLAALRIIHIASNGLPTKINELCEGALALAMERHSPTVTEALMSEFLGRSSTAPTAAAAPEGATIKTAIPSAHAPSARQQWSKTKRNSIAGVTLLAAIAVSAALLSRGWFVDSAPSLVQAPSAELQMAQAIAPESNLSEKTDRLVAAAGEPTPSPMQPVIAERLEASAPSVDVADQPAAPKAPQEQLVPSGDVFPALSSLKDDGDADWGAMGTLWGVTLEGPKSCDEAVKQGHQCFRMLNADLPALTALDRPGLALLQQGATTRWVHLIQRSGDTLTLVVGKESWQMSTTQFATLWSGYFKTLWRLPPEQATRLFVARPDEPAGLWLDQRLQNLQAKGELTKTAGNARSRVAAFQKKHGLPGQGKALPSTFIAVNQLTGVNEPRLSR